MDQNTILKAALLIGPLAIAIIFHEVAHGWVARLFGDQTAARLGRLSLNPIKHIDPVGTVVLPLILTMSGAPVFGWAKPVPVNPNNLRNPRWNMMAVAAAGPAINIALALVGAVIAAFAAKSGIGPLGWSVLTTFVAVNVFLAVFNMLPLPPFDGSKVFGALLPQPFRDQFASFDRFGLLLVLIAFVALPMVLPQLDLVGKIVMPPFEWVMQRVIAFAGMFV